MSLDHIKRSWRTVQDVSRSQGCLTFCIRHVRKKNSTGVESLMHKIARRVQVWHFKVQNSRLGMVQGGEEETMLLSFDREG